MIKKIIAIIIAVLLIPAGQDISRINDRDLSFDTYASVIEENENNEHDEKELPPDSQEEDPDAEITDEEPIREPELEPEPAPEIEEGEVPEIESEKEPEYEVESEVESEEDVPVTGPENEPEDETDGKPEIDSEVDVKVGLPAMSTNMGIPVSIDGVLDSADVSGIAIIPGTDGFSYQAYPGTAAGLQAALFELYQNGNNADYVLYIGSNITVPSAVSAKNPPANPAANDITFSVLSGRVGNLVITGSPTDPVSNATTAPGNAKTLSFGAPLYANSNITLRNINYSVPSIYMQGHDLTLDRGSYSTRSQGMDVYGGTDSGNVSGNPVITVNSTGTGGAYDFYGGNHSGGTLTGNPSIVINNTSGNISSVYGGGYGTSSVNTANVDGNVTTIINNISGAISAIYGGVNYGNISGSVSTSVSGGGRAASGATFHGGSYSGNIGASLPGGSDAIVNIFDSSAYTSGLILFVGGNNESGTIHGNINNTVTAGGFGKGGLKGFYGGGNNNINPAINVVNSAPELRASIFEANADFKVYGNITSELTKGHIGGGEEQGRLRGAGYAGYIEGDVTTVVGTQGLCYGGDNDQSNTDMELSSKLYARGYLTYFDLVGGGGAVFNSPDIIYIKGNTSLILKNILARWVSGGNFSGYLEGNTRNELHSGIVDAIEGAGYNSKGVYGNTSAFVYGGQVDNYVCGGGWDDDLIDGNVHVEVHGGMINASLSGTYGYTAEHVVTGNSTVIVKGGLFNGSPRDESNHVSSGPQNRGSIQGNASLTIDLRDGNSFSLPTNFIAGGRRIGAPSDMFLGTNETNTVELNIFTEPGNKVFEKTTLYGDGGTTAAATKSGNIIINIDAPDSSIGKVYATQYTNIAAQAIIKNININIKDAKYIDEIFASSSVDSYNNDSVKRSNGKQIVFNVGGVDSTAETIEIGGAGLANFTELNINKVVLKAVATGGSFKNGRLASAAAHGNTFNEFGDITISNGGGLGILAGGSAIISGGVLAINGDAELLSPSGHGIVNITEFSATGDGCLTWTRTGGDSMLSMTGSWFGAKQAYRVITFTPVKTNASAIGPDRLYSVDSVTGKTYIGDNDITDRGLTGYGLAIAGSVIDFRVNEGEGYIEHNVAGVSAGPPPVTVYGNPAMNVQVREGKLFIPSAGSRPTLTFVPDVNLRFRVKEIVILRSDNTVQTIEELLDFESALWSSSSNDYSYKIVSAFTGKNLNEVAFNFYKVDAMNTEIVLEAAVFALYRPGEEWSEPSPPDGPVTSESVALGIWTPVLTEEDVPLSAESGTDGFVDFGMLVDGVYMLVETKAPLSHAKPVGQWQIETDSKQAGHAQIAITGKGDILPPAFLRDEADNLLLPNQRALNLPASGSETGLGLALISASLILCALILVIFRIRKSFHDSVQNRHCDFAETNK